MKNLAPHALGAFAISLSFSLPAWAQAPRQERPLSPHWQQALETVERDNLRLGTAWEIPDARARSWGLTAGFLYPLARNLDRQRATVSEDVEFVVGHHPDARPKDPSDPHSPLVLRQRRNTGTPDGAVAFLTDASQGLTVPHGLETLPNGPVGQALRVYGQSMNSAPIDPSGRFRDVTGRAHGQLVEALSRQAATIRGPEAYTPGPDGQYSREDLLRMAADRHFLAQVQGQLWENSIGNYLQTAEQLHGVELTEEQAQRFSAASPVEANLTRVLREAGVLDFAGGRYDSSALPQAQNIPPPPTGLEPVSPVHRPQAPEPKGRPAGQPPGAGTSGPFGVPNS